MWKHRASKTPRTVWRSPHRSTGGFQSIQSIWNSRVTFDWPTDFPYNLFFDHFTLLLSLWRSVNLVVLHFRSRLLCTIARNQASLYLNTLGDRLFTQTLYRTLLLIIQEIKLYFGHSRWSFSYSISIRKTLGDYSSTIALLNLRISIVITSGY